LGHASLFAQLFGGALELVHVVEEVGQANPAFWAAEPALAGQLQRRAVASAEAAMQRWLPTSPVGDGLRLETRVLSGTVPGTLAEYAGETGASLMVVSTHGRTGLSRWLLGSVSERLLRTAPCPVLIARGGSAGGLPALKQVLEAVDLSEHSHRALQTAGEIARRSGAALEVLYVWAAPFYDASEHFDAELFERIRQSARAELDEFVASASLPPSLALQISIESGTPSERIGQHLQARLPDLLVLGSHGHGGVRRLVLGSVAEVTVRYAPCAALVVPRARNSEG
jgi:nucleotide-binding universal stress UspA family protein